MNKRPALQFYPGDWWRANDIKGCSMSTQGVWFNLLMAMWDAPEQGKISGSEEAIKRIVGANDKEFGLFLLENKARNFANVTIRNHKVTIKNRRMYKEYLARTDTKMRVRKHRQQARLEGNREVTRPSSTSSSSSNTYTIENTKNSCILNGIPESNAQSYYDHYNSQGWLKGNGQPITNLQSHMAKRWDKSKQCWDFDIKKFKDKKKPPEDEKVCVVCRNVGYKYNLNRSKEKIWLCADCDILWSKTGRKGGWGYLKISDLENIILKAKAKR